LTKVVSSSRSTKKLYGYASKKLGIFAKGDKVFLKMAPMKGITRFGKQGKLNPNYIGPFEISRRVGPVAYCLALPPGLANIYNVFHVSMLRKYISGPSHIIKYETL
jgi:hypothetical protein